MAHPMVENLKDLGLRHGEKAGLALVGVICLFFLFKAATGPRIELTPDQLSTQARQAQSNINADQKEEAILAKLEADGITESDFEAVVDSRQSSSVDASKYELANSFMLPEPGAGLIRDMPKLLAPTELFAAGGRGGAIFYEVDEQGNIVQKEPEKEPKKTSTRRGRRSRRGGGASPYGGNAYGNAMGGGGQDEETAAEKQARLRREQFDERQKQARAIGERGVEEADEEEQQQLDNAKEITRGIRWGSLIGLIDHRAQREAYARALKVDYGSAHPHYLRLDVERQSQLPDGSWSEWTPLDEQSNEEAMKYLAWTDGREDTPEEARLEALVDTLPLLKVGFWHGITNASLLPKEKPKPKEETKPGTGSMAQSGGQMMGSSVEVDYSKMGQQSNYGAMMKGRMGAGMASANYAGGGGYGGAGRASGGGYGGGASAANEVTGPTTDADKILARSLDYTVEPDVVYRYRMRLVVRNPNWGHEDVAPGVDTKTEELEGPWSEPSNPISVPADVASFVVDTARPTPDRPANTLAFEVVKWDPTTGLTVLHDFPAAPGEIIGTTATARVPDEEYNKIESKTVDFTSRQLLVDALGGPAPLDPLRLGGAPVDAPALAVILRPDGILAVRDSARDTTNPELADLRDSYELTLKEIEDKEKAEKDKDKSGAGNPYGGNPYGGRGGGR